MWSIIAVGIACLLIYLLIGHNSDGNDVNVTGTGQSIPFTRAALTYTIYGFSQFQENIRRLCRNGYIWVQCPKRVLYVTNQTLITDVIQLRDKFIDLCTLMPATPLDVEMSLPATGLVDVHSCLQSKLNAFMQPMRDNKKDETAENENLDDNEETKKQRDHLVKEHSLSKIYDSLMFGDRFCITSNGFDLLMNVRQSIAAFNGASTTNAVAQIYPWMNWLLTPRSSSQSKQDHIVNTINELSKCAIYEKEQGHVSVTHGAASVLQRIVKHVQDTNRLESTMRGLLSDWLYGSCLFSDTLYQCLRHLAEDDKRQRTCHIKIKELFSSSHPPSHLKSDDVPYAMAVVYETLRIQCMQQSVLMYRAQDSHQVDERMTIPKDTVIALDTAAFLLDEQIFPEPMEFNPERFIESSGRLNRSLISRLMKMTCCRIDRNLQNLLLDCTLYLLVCILQTHEMTVSRIVRSRHNVLLRKL